MRQRNDRTATTILLLLGILPVIWCALLTAPHIDQGLLTIIEGLSAVQGIIWHENSMKTILIFLLVYGLGIGIFLSSARNYRRGEEHGSAKWGDPKQLAAKYADKDRSQNLLFTNHVRMGLDGRVHRRNLNVLIVGGSGSGKTRFYAKPNVMQANTSFVILDPKGEILRDTGHLLEQMGYEIRILDLINPHKSHCFNPFVYLRNDMDVLRLVTNLIKNTNSKQATGGDPFWEQSEIALLQAIILYIMHEAPPEEQNFITAMEMFLALDVREEDEGYVSVLDELFERLAMREPDHIAVKQFAIFKKSGGKTAKSILISLGVRLAKMNLPEILGLLAMDEIDIRSLGEKKTALFAVISDSDSSLNFIVGMLYSMVFQELYYSADHVHGGRLPVHVHCVMDEFANVALPDEFDKLLATMRSREISVSIIIQNIAQLKALFEKQWESIVGNCDTFLYLGGNEDSTHELVSKKLGKETIDTNTYGKSEGRSGSYSTNYQLSGRELMTPDEVRMLDNRFTLLFLRGERAVMDEKYDILRHPNIRLTTDGGAKPYVHGLAPKAIDPEIVPLSHEINDYIILSEEEINQCYENEKENLFYVNEAKTNL